jgi:hypothetical protein
MKLLFVACFAVLACGITAGQGYRPPRGFVPDAATAVKIAEAVMIPVYGEATIKSERPFKATLQDDTWTVTGTFRCPDGNGGTTSVCAGGVAVVRLSKSDAKIISMIHGK